MIEHALLPIEALSLPSGCQIHYLDQDEGEGSVTISGTIDHTTLVSAAGTEPDSIGIYFSSNSINQAFINNYIKVFIINICHSSRDYGGMYINISSGSGTIFNINYDTPQDNYSVTANGDSRDVMIAPINALEFIIYNDGSYYAIPMSFMGQVLINGDKIDY